MTLDMTKGPPARLMLRFALPMLVGNLFQQFYNIVDTLIVGRFVWRDALAAVGSTFAIMTLVNSLLIGLSMGAATLFSQQFGAKDYKKLKTTIFLSSCFIMGMAFILAVLTFSLTDQICRKTNSGVHRTEVSVGFIGVIKAPITFWKNMKSHVSSKSADTSIHKDNSHQISLSNTNVQSRSNISPQ